MSLTFGSTGPAGPVGLIEPLLDTNEVARLLGISRSKAADLIGRGVIESLRIGSRSRRVRPEALQRYLERCEAEAATGSRSF